MPLRSAPSAGIVVDHWGIRIALFDGNKPVLCAIDWGALADRAIADGDDEGDVCAAYLRHRETIWAIASKNYDAGQEQPIVTTYQLTPLA